jgi:hypothetical protein
LPAICRCRWLSWHCPTSRGFSRRPQRWHRPSFEAARKSLEGAPNDMGTA